MRNRKLFLLIIPFLTFILIGCGSGGTDQTTQGHQEEDPDLSRSEKVIKKTMKAMGGEEKWEKTRYFQWNFFGYRKLWWDKTSGDVRIEVPKEKIIILMNLDSMSGKAYVDRNRIRDEDSLKSLLETGRKIWINDSYWLFMPFKLKDEGVQTHYMGVDTLEDGTAAFRLKLTFHKVGVTPQNKYHIWIDTTDHLVRKWAYFSHKDSTRPRMITPWTEYKEYNGLLLSSGRGKKNIKDIAVPDTIPLEVFQEP